MIAVIDYGVGNLFSLKSSLAAIGQEAVVTRDQEELDRADHILLPGVGAFGDAVEKLRSTGMDRAVLRQAAAGKPLLGICLGMQLLFETSFEYGEHRGLELISGQVRDIGTVLPGDLAIPHMGWNKLVYNHDCPLFDGLGDDEYVYFVHSYKAFCDNKNLYAYCEYGSKVPAVVSDGRYIFGCQFHPEKSGKTGLKILENFAKLSQEVK